MEEGCKGFYQKSPKVTGHMERRKAIIWRGDEGKDTVRKNPRKLMTG